MTQHLRDSIRYLYKETETVYEQLLSAAREAETEWVESKTIKAKVTSVVDPGKKERDELKARIDKLIKELNKKEKGSFYKKKNGKGENTTPWTVSFIILYLSFVCYLLYVAVIVRARSSRTECSQRLVVLLVVF